MDKSKEYTLDELNKKLTMKQKNFCHEYVVDWNASRAAREAGYSKKIIRQIGVQNISKHYIKQYINYIKNDYEFLCGISKTKQIKELQKLAYSSIAHLHDTWIELKEFESLTNNQKDSIESIDTKIEVKTRGEQLVNVEYVKVRLYSKTQALAEINKMMAYYDPEKKEIKHSGEIKGEKTIKIGYDLGDDQV